jgi:hypothetical protein
MLSGTESVQNTGRKILSALPVHFRSRKKNATEGTEDTESKRRISHPLTGQGKPPLFYSVSSVPSVAIFFASPYYRAAVPESIQADVGGFRRRERSVSW